MSTTTNKLSPEVRERAVRMLPRSEKDHPSRWAAVISIVDKFDCPSQSAASPLSEAEEQHQGMLDDTPMAALNRLR